MSATVLGTFNFGVGVIVYAFNHGHVGVPFLDRRTLARRSRSEPSDISHNLD